MSPYPMQAQPMLSNLWEIFVVGFVLFAIYGLYRLFTDKNSPGQILGRDIHRLTEQNKGKAPVVYLRSFLAEGLHASDIKSAFIGKVIPGTEAHWGDVGHMVLSFLRVVGPPIELAPPVASVRLKSWSPSRPQQERIDNELWQQKILELLSRTALMVVQLGASPGLTWELSQLVRRVPPIRILLVLPPTQSEYAALCSATASVFPRPLPRTLPDSRLMTFRPNWEPLPLEARGGPGGMWYTLKSVFEQNRFEAPAWRPAYGLGERRIPAKGS